MGNEILELDDKLHEMELDLQEHKRAILWLLNLVDRIEERHDISEISQTRWNELERLACKKIRI